MQIELSNAEVDLLIGAIVDSLDHVNTDLRKFRDSPTTLESLRSVDTALRCLLNRLEPDDCAKHQEPPCQP